MGRDPRRAHGHKRQDDGSRERRRATASRIARDAE
jgi:hypothetical protein